MKLNFKKNEEGKIELKNSSDSKKDFSYVEMVKELKKGKKIKVSFEAGFSIDEKNAVNEMIDKINEISSE